MRRLAETVGLQKQTLFHLGFNNALFTQKVEVDQLTYIHVLQIDSTVLNVPQSRKLAVTQGSNHSVRREKTWHEHTLTVKSK